ncbi:MAG: RyR domain-containing protein [Nitrospirales bacterium]
MTSDYEQHEREVEAGAVVDRAELAKEDGSAYLKGHAIYAMAMIAHATNAAYRHTLGQETVPWYRLTREEQMSVVMGVSAIVEQRVRRPRDSHDHWLRTKHAMGWKYGHEKNVALKTHPDIVEWDFLHEDEQRKDMLFFGIVVALLADPKLFGEGPAGPSYLHASDG